MIGTLLQPEIEEIIHGKRWDELRDVLSLLDPPDVAELIVDLPPRGGCAGVSVFAARSGGPGVCVFAS